MFESAQLGQTLSKEEFEAREPDLRERLLDAQFRLKEAGFSAVVVIAGAEGAGKGDAVNLLLSWLDARGVSTHALGAPSEEEQELPEHARFWRRLPPKGQIAIFFGSWYTRPIAQHSLGQIDDAELEDALRRIVDLEEMLGREDVLLIKCWLHITKAQQGKRFRKLAGNPDTAWRVTKQDWQFHRTYDEFVQSASRAIRRTSSGGAPWHVIEASNARYRDITISETMLAALERRLAEPAPPHPPVDPLPSPAPVNVLSRLDLSQSLAVPEYREQLEQLQLSIGRMSRHLRDEKRAVVLVFEGTDAAGKGGSIRRVTQALDARAYSVVSIAAPTDEEQARPYLWRFWRRLPRWGRFTIFDRSWYGRVLVERLEGFCAPVDWRRAFGEINAFEEQVIASGAVLLKFWLTTSAEEQLRRFQEREAMGYKHYKITEEDWRNREKWDAYTAAACDMIERTSSEIAPWTIVEAEDKRFARVKVLRTVNDALAAALAPRRSRS